MVIAEKTTARISDAGTITKLDLNGFQLCESVFTVDHSDPAFRIRQAVIYLVVSGEFQLWHNGYHLICRAGEGIFINADGQTFSQSAVAGTKLFSCSIRTEWFSKHEIEITHLTSQQFSKTGPLHNLACALYRVYKIIDEQAALAACGNLQLFFAELLAAGKKPQVPEWLDKAVKIIHEKFAEKISISSLAKQLGITPGHLSDGFQKYHQCTPTQYLHKVKVDQAALLLADKQINENDIPHLCGFYDQSHYISIFKRYMKMTPCEYKKMI